MDVVRGRETAFRTEDPMASNIQVYGADWCGPTHTASGGVSPSASSSTDYFNIDDDQAAANRAYFHQ